MLSLPHVKDDMPSLNSLPENQEWCLLNVAQQLALLEIQIMVLKDRAKLVEAVGWGVVPASAVLL
jgi:hypothetical protein